VWTRAGKRQEKSENLFRIDASAAKSSLSMPFVWLGRAGTHGLIANGGGLSFGIEARA